MPLTIPTERTSKSSIEQMKTNDQIILIIFIIILSCICFILILIIIFLYYRRKPKPIDTTIMNTNTLKRPPSSLSVVEKFQAPDLTTKVTLLTHYHLNERDFGTDV